jgi:hypothetical protein
MKKRFIIPLCSLLMILIPFQGSIFGSLSVKAVDTELTITRITQTNMNTIKSYFATNKPNWYTDYNYFVYYTTVWKVMLVPKTNTAAVIFANNQADSTYYQDIDEWRYQITCTTASPCIVYQFNSNYTFNNTYSFTTNQDQLITFSVSHTNFQGWTYYNQFVPGQPLTTSKTSIMLENYGLIKFPTDWAQTWGYIAPSTDEQQTYELIKANWGMFQWFADGINAIWSAAMPIMTDTVSGLSGVSADLSTGFVGLVVDLSSSLLGGLVDLFEPSEGVLDQFESTSQTLRDAVPYIAQLGSFFENMNPDANVMIPEIQGTILGKSISFDFKEAIFDPFADVAALIKVVLQFVIWFQFSILMWKEGQALINGATTTMGGAQ